MKEFFAQWKDHKFFLLLVILVIIWQLWNIMTHDYSVPVSDEEWERTLDNMGVPHNFD